MRNHLRHSKIILSLILASFIFIFLILHPPLADAQNSRPDVEFVQLFNALQQDLPRERLHLHTDRQWYFYGDRIWFSSYLTAGSLNAPSLISKVIYVDLYSPAGELIERVAIENEEGRSRGSLTIEHNEEPGIYKLKAYTAWTLNFGESYGVTRNISVHLGERAVATGDSELFDVGFYPEGGDLVEGLESKVGFKAVESNGSGKEISGVIYDQDGQVITKIRSEHSGMGSFRMTPDSDKRYYAIVEDQRFDLPEIRSRGFAFSVTENDHEQFFIRLRSSDPEENSSYLVFGHVRGEVYLAASIELMNGSGFTVAPKNMFATGPVHFTVLSHQGDPIAERLVFNYNPSDIVKAEIKTDQGIYTFRDQVELNVSVTDSEEEFVTAHSSISVFDDALDEYNPYASNIQTKLLLESDIPGYIENPGYYFSDSDDRNAHADLLMLTQGWRAFDMEEIRQTDEISLFSIPEDGIMLTGQISSPFRGRGLPDATVVFSLGDNQDNMQIVDTDEDGFFSITDLNITGSQPINIRANDSDGGDNVRIRLSEPYSHLPVDTLKINQSGFSPLVIFNREHDQFISPEQLAERASTVRIQTEDYADVQMQGELEEVIVTSERDTDDQFERDLRVGSSGSQRLDLDERPQLNDLPIELIVNQIPGVSANQNSLAIRTGAASFSSPVPPLVILDGIETNWTTIISIPATDIQTINVYRRTTELAAYGTRGSGGVLLVRTRKGAGISQSTRGFTTAFVEGYQTPTRFYSPRYGFSVPRDKEEKDSRITLHWDPEIHIEDGNSEISFWVNDIPSTYRAVIEGITDFGVPFIQTVTFEVEN